MKSNTLSLFAGVAVLALNSVCSASPINGSLPLSGNTVTQNGANLLVSTTISDASTLTSGPGAGDYSPIPLSTSYGPATLNLNNFTTFSLSNATFGSFATTSGLIVTQTASFLDVFLLGTYTPGAGLPGKDPTPSSLRISVNQSGTSLSEAISLNSPALPSPGVPEPGTLIMLGVPLVGLGLYGRRFRLGSSK
jgi:hypothetical protein